MSLKGVNRYFLLAQTVEQRTVNAEVNGSSPLEGVHFKGKEKFYGDNDNTS